VTGTYYPRGRAICCMMNKERKTTGIRCSVLAIYLELLAFVVKKSSGIKAFKEAGLLK